MMRFFPLFLLLILCACSDDETKVQLPYIGHYDLEYSTKDGTKIVDTVYQPILDFSYLNQDSVSVSNATYKNKIWVTEFFFATCPTICPIMNGEMKRLQEMIQEIDSESRVQFLSFSIDPKKDSPAALKKYKRRYCKDCENWDFLTGDEAFTHRLGIESFKVFAGREEQAEGGYAHSGAFSLVDPDGFLRGVYNITDFDGTVNNKESQRLIKDLHLLIENTSVKTN